VKGFNLWDMKSNKVVINKYLFFFFNEKAMLQPTQEEKKQVPENYSNNDHKV
jgi:hypothetical protein